MIRPATFLVALAAISACASTDFSAGPPIQVVQGEQLRIWSVDVRTEADTLILSAQVNRTALPRGPLREHVHVEILNDAGTLIATQDASIYPVTALRGEGSARLTATLRVDSVDGSKAVQLRVVEGIPHD